MRVLTRESATKLQTILSKRLGRLLSQSELEEAYENLMDFAMALVDLDTNFIVEVNKKIKSVDKQLYIHV
jgi:hypothetical protein